MKRRRPRRERLLTPAQTRRENWFIYACAAIIVALLAAAIWYMTR